MERIGKYEVVRRLASGGMAEVFLASATGPHGFRRRCVLKRILPELAADATFVDMFLSEARIAGQLSHANLAQVYEVGEVDDSYFLAMEYVDGPDLRALSRQARQRGMAVDPYIAAKIVSFACEGLRYAHAFCDPDTGHLLNIVHRDISPDNIILTRAGGVKVVDFGIAKAAVQRHQTQTGIVKGKPAYMAPEQMERKEVDQRADVFSLGVVLYELLSGSRPYDAKSEIELIHAIILKVPTVPLRKRRPDVPDELARIVERAITREVSGRYADCAAFQADLDRFIHRASSPVGPAEIAQFIEQAGAKGTWSQEWGGTPPQPSATARSTPEHAKVDTRAQTVSLVLAPATGPGRLMVPASRVTGALPPPVPMDVARRRRVALLAASVAVAMSLGVGFGLWFTSPGRAPLLPPVEPAAEAARPPEPTPAPAPVVTADAPPPSVPEVGTLLVRAMPYAAVYVDGKYVRDVQGRGALKLRAGAHKVALQHPRGKAEFSVTIVAGQERRVEKSFLAK